MCKLLPAKHSTCLTSLDIPNKPMTEVQALCPLQAGKTETQMKMHSCKTPPRGRVRIYPQSSRPWKHMLLIIWSDFPNCMWDPLVGFQMCPSSSSRAWVPPTTGQRLRSFALTYTFFLLLNKGEGLSPGTLETCLIMQLFQKRWAQNPGVHTAACMTPPTKLWFSKCGPQTRGIDNIW